MPRGGRPAAEGELAKARPTLHEAGEWRHRRKDGSVIDVSITSHTLEFAGRPAALSVEDLARTLARVLHGSAG